jgi:heat-inducible transcriptional repressor
VKTGALSKRERRILKTIVEAHVRTARPVSSAAVARGAGVQVSSATIRNVMRRLEQRGLVTQPHTSAGRTPTDRGYRYYVDGLMEPSGPTPSERMRIDRRLSEASRRGLGSLVAEASKLVSGLAKELAVSVAPATELHVIERVELVSLEDGRVLAVATTRSGRTRSAAIGPAGSSAREIDAAGRLVNRWLGGVPIDDAERTLRRAMRGGRAPGADLVRRLLEVSSVLFRPAIADRIHYDGARYIFRHPEFSSEAAVVGRILDSDESIVELLPAPEGGSRVSVTIGRENAKREMRGMALVVGSYAIEGQSGRVGVIGPTRMRYPKIIGLVDYLSAALDELLTGGR